jgi:hypothetical protein
VLLLGVARRRRQFDGRIVILAFEHHRLLMVHARVVDIGFEPHPRMRSTFRVPVTGGFAVLGWIGNEADRHATGHGSWHRVSPVRDAEHLY